VPVADPVAELVEVWDPVMVLPVRKVRELVPVPPPVAVAVPAPVCVPAVWVPVVGVLVVGVLVVGVLVVGVLVVGVLVVGVLMVGVPLSSAWGLRVRKREGERGLRVMTFSPVDCGPGQRFAGPAWGFRGEGRSGLAWH
jgi:hypothetical protein